MRLCVLQSSYENSASPFGDHDPPSTVEAYAPPGWKVDYFPIHKASAVSQVRQIVRRGFDVVVNLCDGAEDEDRAGMEVVKTLEQLNIPFTGADSIFYEPSKETMKKICIYYGISTSPFVFAYNTREVEVACSMLEFPVIVKHFNGYSSIGMSPSSRCANADELRCEANKFLNSFGGALIEEFIEGREFTVLVMDNPDNINEPIALQPIECAFPPGETFKHFEAKWVSFEGLHWKKVEDDDLATKLKEMSKTLYVGCRGRSYGRTDIRQRSSDGKLFMLEINPNCGLFYPPSDWGSADHIIGNSTMNHTIFLEMIVKAALERHRRIQKVIDFKYIKGRGYGMYAYRNICAGELISQHEEEKHFLVSKSRVMTQWSPLKKAWFNENAYPVSDDVYVMWSDEPTEWKPINHSCDPNSWLLGLDLVARRDISDGEEITMDYSTFCIETMGDFECWCGAHCCRRQVSGLDYQRKDLYEKYSGHLSAYVESWHSKHE
jgi:D-alanine-D-alanine ligase-like ATP-grasp enzyme